MKIIAIGDIHGKTIWKDIVESEEFDKVVFIGDYVDTHEDISPARQIKNLEEILAYKSNNKDDVVLLLGNHDYHYLPGISAEYSRFQGNALPQFRGIFKNALDKELVQACYMEDGVIYTHAGVSRIWARDNHINVEDYTPKEVQEYINNYFLYNTSKFGFQLSKQKRLADPTGDNAYQSPMWIRPQSLLTDKLHGFKQVVGHTRRPEIVIYNDIAFIDVLDNENVQYLEVNDGEFKSKMLNKE